MSKNMLAQECPPPGEDGFIRDIAARLKAKLIQDNPNGIMPRDAHPKMHGVLKAEFIIEADLPDHLRVGIFKEPRTLHAWIRFSNANASIQPDINRDIRGMAIKLMGVPGEKLLDGEKDAQTQDFLLIDSSVFMNRNVQGFDRFLQVMTGSIFSKILFFATQWRFIGILLRSFKKIANPLQTRFWSTTPYLFGDTAVKYSAIPHVTVADAIPDNPSDNYLRTAMTEQLTRWPAVFDFCVQCQTNAETMPIEDPSVEWDEAVASFQKVATIRILQQNFDSEKQNRFGENLSFTPWHSLPEHRPLGGINRARKVVYECISTFRHSRNDVPKIEPTSWDI